MDLSRLHQKLIKVRTEKTLQHNSKQIKNTNSQMSYSFCVLRSNVMNLFFFNLCDSVKSYKYTAGALYEFIVLHFFGPLSRTI